MYMYMYVLTDCIICGMVSCMSIIINFVGCCPASIEYHFVGPCPAKSIILWDVILHRVPFCWTLSCIEYTKLELMIQCTLCKTPSHHFVGQCST